jgi:anti-sigma B factor antagonist
LLGRRGNAAPAPPGDAVAEHFAAEEGRRDGWTAWDVSGEIDIATVPLLRAKLESSVARGDVMLVDLTGVTFMDSTGLGLLLDVHQRLESASRRWAIACPEGPARLLCAVTGVESTLPLHLTRAEAEAALT